jgi:hypothetical protein
MPSGIHEVDEMDIPFPLQEQVTTEGIKREIDELQANVSRVIEMRGALVAALVALDEEARQLLTTTMASPLDERPLIGISQMNFAQCAAAHVFSGIEIHILDDVLRFAATPDARFVVSFQSGHTKAEGEFEAVLIGGNPIEGLEASGSGAQAATMLVVRPANGSEIKVKTADLLAVFITKAAVNWRDRARLASRAAVSS